MTVPAIGGNIEIDMNQERLRVKSCGVACVIRLNGKSYELAPDKELDIECAVSA